MRDKRLDNWPTADHELLLIRAGHHLWKEYKSRSPQGWPENAILAALDTVWAAKEALRVELRAEYLESREKTINRLSQYRYGS